MIESGTADLIESFKSASNLDAFYSHTRAINLASGWLRQPVSPPSPSATFMAAHWRYRECEAALNAAGRLVDVSLAERRNLVLRNPFEGNITATSKTLVCAYQMIMPGEVAPSHRHVPHALRVIIKGTGSYSIVDGERTPMETGDVVLTPGWSWHSHGHDGDEPAYWLDGLDYPLARHFGSTFYEDHPSRIETKVRTVSSSPYRFARDEIARRLDQAPHDPDEAHGPRIRLEAPSMPTIGLMVERLPSNTLVRPQRSTANRIFFVMEGNGTTTAGENEFRWGKSDTIVVPSWTTYAHHAHADSVLFEFNDEPAIVHARYYRRELL